MSLYILSVKGVKLNWCVHHLLDCCNEDQLIGLKDYNLIASHTKPFIKGPSLTINHLHHHILIQVRQLYAFQIPFIRIPKYDATTWDCSLGPSWCCLALSLDGVSCLLMASRDKKPKSLFRCFLKNILHKYMNPTESCGIFPQESWTDSANSL